VIADKDSKELKGVISVPFTLQGLMEARGKYPWYQSWAREQAEDFGNNFMSRTISTAAVRLESLP